MCTPANGPISSSRPRPPRRTAPPSANQHRAPAAQPLSRARSLSRCLLHLSRWLSIGRTCFFRCLGRHGEEQPGGGGARASSVYARWTWDLFRFIHTLKGHGSLTLSPRPRRPSTARQRPAPSPPPPARSRTPPCAGRLSSPRGPDEMRRAPRGGVRAGARGQGAREERRVRGREGGRGDPERD